jgi:ketosteroid isomerase-like protein
MSAVLEAKDAIRELMAAYAQALDACRFADVAACFAADGEWTTDYGAARGPAEIEKFISGIVPVTGEGPQRKHYITNIIIKVDGETASAVSDYLIVRESENGLIPVMGGTYRDKFIKTPAGWRFSRKELEHHIAGDMALKNGR